MAPPSLQQAKRIATEGQSFRIPAAAGVFPPRDIANAFFACGYDDRRDDDEAVFEWEPFELTEEEYQALLEWWQVEHPGAHVDRLAVPDADFSPWFSAAVREAS
jgi:hypothetical protein